MTVHEIGAEIYALVPYVAVVLKGDRTVSIKEGDAIKTRLVCYRVDSIGYDKGTDRTVAVVKEIVP